MNKWYNIELKAIVKYDVLITDKRRIKKWVKKIRKTIFGKLIDEGCYEYDVTYPIEKSIEIHPKTLNMERCIYGEYEELKEKFFLLSKNIDNNLFNKICIASCFYPRTSYHVKDILSKEIVLTEIDVSLNCLYQNAKSDDLLKYLEDKGLLSIKLFDIA